MVIYVVENEINNKKYVGQTIHSLARRWSWHCHYSTGCVALYGAITKYGKENFTIREIDRANTREELDKKERKWISELNTIAPHGYNLKSGGRHCTYSPTSLKKMRDSHKGLLAGAKNPMFGKTHTLEARAKIGAASKGRLHTEEYKMMMSRTLSGANNPNARAVICLDTQETFSTMAQAAKTYSLNNHMGISACCRGRQKTAGGYRWAYLDGKQIEASVRKTQRERGAGIMTGGVLAT